MMRAGEAAKEAAMAVYASVFDAAPQEKYDRVQIALRLAIVLVLAILAGAIGWLYGLIYLAIPVVAAVLISQKGAERYLAESDGNITKWLRYIVAFYAYLVLLTDKLPSDSAMPVRFEVRPTGTPSVGQALLRIILGIPHYIVLALLGIVSVVLWVIAAVMVLIQESYPKGIFDFQRGYVRWYSRVLVYAASLAGEYPPFSLDTGEEPGAAAAQTATTAT
jgi:hypothetical protein